MKKKHLALKSSNNTNTKSTSPSVLKLFCNTVASAYTCVVLDCFFSFSRFIRGIFVVDVVVTSNNE